MTVPLDFCFPLYLNSLFYFSIELCLCNAVSHWPDRAISKSMHKGDPGDILLKDFTSIYQENKSLSITCFRDQPIQRRCFFLKAVSHLWHGGCSPYCSTVRSFQIVQL